MSLSSDGTTVAISAWLVDPNGLAKSGHEPSAMSTNHTFFNFVTIARKLDHEDFLEKSSLETFPLH